MWLRSNSSYNEEELSIMYHALWQYSFNLRLKSDEYLKVAKLLQKIEQEQYSFVNNNI